MITLVFLHDEEADKKAYQIFSWNNHSKYPPQNNVFVEEKPVSMDIVTMAFLSIMSQHGSKLVWLLEEIKLKETSACLKMYTGERIKVLQSSNVLTKSQGKCAILPLLIVH